MSTVAPQLLIAAAMNAYCLECGTVELRNQLRFLKNNELEVNKKDVIVAIMEGIAVKVVFMAITINHDDFIVLGRDLLGPNALGLVEIEQGHTIPGFDLFHTWFIKPVEHVQERLNLPTMAERSSTTLISEEGGWNCMNAASLVENIFLVGSVQGTMEQLIDVAHDRIGEAVHEIHKRMVRKADGQVDSVHGDPVHKGNEQTKIDDELRSWENSELTSRAREESHSQVKGHT
ncbi:hypothetical protein AAFC00_006970 [Neodothiora populina]|uniref:Uncharacterized protein n=1 Tax=Neodothiora populina TaxID=2781224 RepID=A0ABR3PD18_9PEZI